jgi:hypothetical protein
MIQRRSGAVTLKYSIIYSASIIFNDVNVIYRSGFIGWLGSYDLPYGGKQKGDLHPKRLGQY